MLARGALRMAEPRPSDARTSLDGGALGLLLRAAAVTPGAPARFGQGQQPERRLDHPGEALALVHLRALASAADHVGVVHLELDGLALARLHGQLAQTEAEDLIVALELDDGDAAARARQLADLGGRAHQHPA